MNEMRTISADEVETPVRNQRLPRIAAMISVPLLLLAAGLYFWLTSGRTVSTDNAQVGADIGAHAQVAVKCLVEGRVLGHQNPSICASAALRSACSASK